MTSVLFVCLGNICRSPTAEGVFCDLIKKNDLSLSISADSAGTGSWHIGNPPDPRAQSATLSRGIDISGLRARQVTPLDFDKFHYIIAMDNANKSDLLLLCPSGMENKLHLLMDFAPDLPTREVPDPYYGGGQGFERVLDMIEVASTGLLSRIKLDQRLLNTI